MKILIVMGGFFPGKKYGGPPVSIDNFCSLMDEHECFIVTHNHDLFEQEPYQYILDGWNDRENCKVLYLTDKQYNRNMFEQVILELDPDIMYLQGLFQQCIFPCLELGKKYHLKVLLAPRGELCTGAFKKKYKKIPYIYALKVLGLTKRIHFQSTSEEETEAIRKYLNGNEERIHFLPNIPSTPKDEYKKEEKKSGTGKFIFLSRIVPKKNLLYALKCLGEIKGNVEFDIYGPIENKEYWEKCRKVMEQLPQNITVNYKGVIMHDQVHGIFSKYNAFLFPTFSENYGHVIVEAMLARCPIITSDQTPWNSVNDKKAGWALPLDDREGFIKAIQKIVDYDEERNDCLLTRLSEYITEVLNIREVKKAYLKVLEQIVLYE